MNIKEALLGHESVYPKTNTIAIQILISIVRIIMKAI
jgi:hypothetical protein